MIGRNRSAVAATSYALNLRAPGSTFQLLQVKFTPHAARCYVFFYQVYWNLIVFTIWGNFNWTILVAKIFFVVEILIKTDWKMCGAHSTQWKSLMKKLLPINVVSDHFFKIVFLVDRWQSNLSIHTTLKNFSHFAQSYKLKKKS